jgi:hypothetical protein
VAIVVAAAVGAPSSDGRSVYAASPSSIDQHGRDLPALPGSGVFIGHDAYPHLVGEVGRFLRRPALWRSRRK